LKPIILILFMFTSIIPVGNCVTTYIDSFASGGFKHKYNGSGRWYVDSDWAEEFSPQSPYIHIIENGTTWDVDPITVDVYYYYINDGHQGHTPEPDEVELVYSEVATVTDIFPHDFFTDFQYSSSMPIAGTEAAGKLGSWIAEVVTDTESTWKYFWIVEDGGEQFSDSSESSDSTASTDSSESPDTVGSGEDVNFAEITGLTYPSSVGPGETFQLDIDFDYRFDSVVVFNPAIYYPSSDVIIKEEYFEDMFGSGSDTVFFEMTAPDEPGEYELEVVLYYELDGDYWYDEAATDYVDITVFSGSGSSPTVTSGESDEPDGGIPGFPFIAVVLGLFLFTLRGWKYPKIDSTTFS